METKTRAKFRCFLAEDRTQGEWYQKLVKLSPVMPKAYPPSEDEENTKFWKATRSGTIEMYISNQAGGEVFQEGKEYYIDFIPVPEVTEESQAADSQEGT